MLTYAPLPSWSHIAKLFFASDCSDEELAKPWLHQGEKGFWFSRSAWSLYAIAKLRMKVESKNNIKVWFPGYFCNESIAPLRELGADISFYPLSKDGRPDITACEGMLAKGSPDLFVFVHYFGAKTPANGISDFVKKNDAWLIEDAAQVLRPEEGIGEVGDFVLYSPHKFLSIPDGALLVIRDSCSGILLNDFLGKFDFISIYDSMVNPSEKMQKSAYIWLLKRLLQKLGARSKHYSSASFEGNDAVMKADGVSHPKMSLLGRKLLFLLLDGLGAEASIRKENQKSWGEYLKNSKLIDEDIVPLPSGTAPYLAGFNFSKVSIAKRFFLNLKKAKVPATTWPDLPPEVLSDVKKYGTASLMRETRIFLPVHRSINATSINAVKCCGDS